MQGIGVSDVPDRLSEDLTGNKGDTSLAFFWFFSSTFKFQPFDSNHIFCSQILIAKLLPDLRQRTARRLKGLEGWSANAIEMLQGMILCQET
jgi:hypothetical protein